MATELKNGRFLRLATEIEADVQDLRRLAAEGRSLLAAAPAEPERVFVNGAAKLAHDLYEAVERVLVRVAREFGDSPHGDTWHSSVLRTSAHEIDGLRPPVLASDTVAVLGRYLRFRHKFRNLYYFDLRWDEVAALLRDGDGATARVEADLATFANFLRALHSRLT